MGSLRILRQQKLLYRFPFWITGSAWFLKSSGPVLHVYDALAILNPHVLEADVSSR